MHRQFEARVASHHTSDTMPSRDALLDMEDAWLDDDVGAAGRRVGAGGQGGGDVGELGGNSFLRCLVHGMCVGFFFPLGGAAWLLREEDMLSRNWRTCILYGILFNLAMTVTRTISS